MSDIYKPEPSNINSTADNSYSVDRAEFISNALGSFGRAMSDKIDAKVEAATGLSKSFCYAIVQIGSEPNSSIETLRRIMQIDHSTMVRCLDKLQKMGIANRGKNNVKDSRVVTVNLTDLGEEKFTQILDSRRQYLQKITSSLTEAELEILNLLMSKMFQSTVDVGDDQHYVCRLCDLEACPQEICPVNCAYPDNFELPEQPFMRRADSRQKH